MMTRFMLFGKTILRSANEILLNKSKLSSQYARAQSVDLCVETVKQTSCAIELYKGKPTVINIKPPMFLLTNIQNRNCLPAVYSKFLCISNGTLYGMPYEMPYGMPSRHLVANKIVCSICYKDIDNDKKIAYLSCGHKCHIECAESRPYFISRIFCSTCDRYQKIEDIRIVA